MASPFRVALLALGVLSLLPAASALDPVCADRRLADGAAPSVVPGVSVTWDGASSGCYHKPGPTFPLLDWDYYEYDSTLYAYQHVTIVLPTDTLGVEGMPAEVIRVGIAFPLAGSGECDESSCQSFQQIFPRIALNDTVVGIDLCYESDQRCHERP